MDEMDHVREVTVSHAVLVRDRFVIVADAAPGDRYDVTNYGGKVYDTYDEAMNAGVALLATTKTRRFQIEKWTEKVGD